MDDPDVRAGRVRGGIMARLQVGRPTNEDGPSRRAVGEQQPALRHQFWNGVFSAKYS